MLYLLENLMNIIFLIIHEHGLIFVGTILPNQKTLKNCIFNQWTVNYFRTYLIPPEYIFELGIGIFPSVVFFSIHCIFLLAFVSMNKSQYILPGTYWIIKNIHICRLSLALNTKDDNIFCHYDMIQVLLQ